MNSQPITCNIIMVHFGEPGTTTTSLQALLTAKKQPEHIIIVDHGATPYQPPPSLLSKVRVIRPPTNEGYGAGINVGLGALVSQGVKMADIVIAMNNDSVVSPDTLSYLLEWWNTTHFRGVVGAMGGQLNPLTGRTAPARRFSGFYSFAYIDGMFMAASYATWLRLKGLPDSYFLYWEDVVFCLRAASAGVPLQLLPRLAISHPASSQSAADEHLYYLIRNGVRCYQQELPLLWRGWWYICNRIRWIYHSLFLQKSHHAFIRRALSDGMRHVTGRYR